MPYISATHVDDQVIVWERDDSGQRIVRDYPAPYYFYYDDKDGEYTTIFDTPVSKREFTKQSKYRAARKEYESDGVRMWETDISPEIRVLSNHYYGLPAPKLHVTFFDIEVDYDPQIGFSSITNPYAPINSVAILHSWKNELVVIVVPPEAGWNAKRLEYEVNKVEPVPSKFTTRYIVCEDEAELLLCLLSEFKDSDVLSGWNSDLFDVPYVAQRITRTLDNQFIDLSTTESIAPNGKVSLAYVDNPNNKISQSPGKFRCFKQLDFPTFGKPSWRVVTTTAGKLMGHTVDLVGRVRLDYLNLYKKYEPGERASYKLAAIADLVLVDEKTKEPILPKMEYEGSLADLYRQNFAFFVRYNIRDTEILDGFETKLGYVEIANQNCHLSTALFSHVGGTLKLAELALINYCHHTLKRVVKNVTEPEIDRQIDGALVLYPQVGMHEFVGSIDITSLYPTAIRSLNISPETIRGQFEGCELDFHEIASGTSMKLLTLVFEGDKRSVTKSAEDWREYFIERKWAVSGYGTVFDQTKMGFIPALLGEWFALRMKYQKMKKEAIAAGDSDKAGYYDRLQYVYKIKLNSLYGALSNLYFRFYDLRMGESTTGSGRAILRHQCRTVAKILDGKYDVDFPMYDTIKDAMETGYTEDEARLISLHGPRFNGKHESNTVVYGDTDSVYFKTYAENAEDAIMIADAVAAKVNQSYQPFMAQTFLCTPGYDNLVKCGREVVVDRGIFVEKKRYILHLIDLDGKKVDKMKIMGLDTKKTTLPAHVSAELNAFIERFLKGESWDSVAVTIVDYKEKLSKSEDVTLIGLPKGVRGIEEYTGKYADDAGARLPGHVAASIYYNECLVEYKDKVSQPIISGMKIKVYYLKGKHGKFKSIALPTDIEVVPSWFLENFVVDRVAHIERLVDNPLSNILKAIGKTPPSAQSLLVDSLLSF